MSGRMPGNLRDTVAEPIWCEIEQMGHLQGLDPSRGAVVVISNPSDKLRRDCETLAAIGGAQVSDGADGLEVKLAYEGETVTLHRDTPSGERVRASAKPHTVASFL